MPVYDTEASSRPDHLVYLGDEILSLWVVDPVEGVGYDGEANRLGDVCPKVSCVVLEDDA